MRNRMAFFSVAVPAAVVLLAGGTAVAGAPAGASVAEVVVVPPAPPTLMSCTVPFTNVTFTVSKPPYFVTCGEGGEQCTEIEYQATTPGKIGQTPFQGSVYALEGKGVWDVWPWDEGTSIGLPCVGLNYNFGNGACHEQAIRTYTDESGKFSITLEGLRRPSPTSVGVLGEGEIMACEILGIGIEDVAAPDQLKLATEKVDFKGCVVEFTRDAKTGEVVKAMLAEDNPEGCMSPFSEGQEILPQPVEQLTLTTKGGLDLGKGKFGEGYISSGKDSCTTRVIGGRVYTWGSPCP